MNSDPKQKHAKLKFYGQQTKHHFLLSKQFVSSSTQHIENTTHIKNSFSSNKKIKVNSLNTPPTSRANSPSSPHRKLSSTPKKSLNINQKGGHMNTNQTQGKIIFSFKRRTKSQQKPNNQKFSITSNKTQQRHTHNSSSSKINFVKKLIEDLKKQTSMLRKEKHKKQILNSRYQNVDKLSRSMDTKGKSQILSKQRIINNSLQKLKPSFCSNQIRLSVKKNSILNFERSNSKDGHRSYIHSSKRQQSGPSIEEKISQHLQISTKNDFILQESLKMAQNMTDYLHYIHGKPSQKYSLNMKFLRQLQKIQKKDLIKSILDLNCLKLIQSLYLCISDILRMGNDINYQILKEYAIVYFQSYNKFKIQYTFIEIMFKSLRKKLAQFFIYQRIIFSLMMEICFNKNSESTLINLGKLIQALSLSQQIHSFIVNMFFQEVSSKADHAIIDTFKSLRLTRQLDKRLPIIQSAFINLKFYPKKQVSLSSSNNEKTHQINERFFDQVFKAYQTLLSHAENDSFEYQDLSKLQMYFAWKYFMTPPLFYIPVTTQSTKPYTLILDLDCTLVYYNQESRILKYRPYMDKFLFTMQNYFQLILFSSNTKQRTDIITKEIERDERIFKYRLYKSHMIFDDGCLRKNLSFIGLRMEKTVFIDDQQKNIVLNSENSYRIKPFQGNKQDKQLLHVCDWISAIMEEKPLDIRGKLKKPQNYLDSIQELDEKSTIHRSVQHDV